ncbi:MAG: flagellar motor protein MotB [Bacteroidota bacterium]
MDLDAPEPASEEPTAPFWMATYSDMVTLLLAFFVMLVAMSEVEVKKFEEALSYFTGRRGILEQEGLMPGIMGVVAEQTIVQQSREYDDLARFVQDAGLADAVEVDLTERGIRITFADSIAFASGSAALTGPAQSMLDRVATSTRVASTVEVEGHTDDQPIATSAFPSNWELSAARAATVVRFLMERPDALAPDKYAAIAYGEHRPRASNATPEGRARNRRIAILLRSKVDAEPPRGPISTPDSLRPFDPFQ